MRYSFEHYERNDPHFEKDLEKSKAHVNFLVDLLVEKGYKVRAIEGKVREKIEDMCKYSDEGDVEIEYDDGRIGIIEIKRRISCNFNSPSINKFPFREGTLIVDVAHHYDGLNKKPDGYIITNDSVDCCFFVNCEKTYKHWIKKERWDNAKKRMRTFYECHISHLRFGRINVPPEGVLTI